MVHREGARVPRDQDRGSARANGRAKGGHHDSRYGSHRDQWAPRCPSAAGSWRSRSRHGPGFVPCDGPPAGGGQVIVADFDQPNTLDAALAGAERCLLLSAVDTRLVERETRFVERARKAKLAHLVKVSAIGAHPAASFTFGRQHGEAERMIMDSGLPFTFVQPNFFMQNLLWSAEPIKTRGELYSSLGSTPASHIDARDIAAVVATTLAEPLDRHAGRIHLLTGPAALTFDQVAELFTRVLKKQVRYLKLSAAQVKAGLIGAG